ncbi:MAG: MFS transporter [Acidimicrobiia bacterium]|nr:MFS transporter [Acidimicrobiia bacterium]MYE73557.1 MFS transporter [Acidimicrobiia bacterium]MYJ62304.1 MFS transporter [Acidimicrobiia bacterium]
MPQVISRRVLSADAADVVLNGPDGLLSPRSDIVLERATDEAGLSTAEAVFTAVEGPVEHYRRTVTTEPLSNGRVQVNEQFDYRLAIPVWWVLFTVPFSRALRQGREWPWWHPPDRFTARQARVVALLATLAVVAGFLGTLLGQTITFAADEFEVGESAQGLALSLVRLSILITLAVAALGDRKGRQRILLLAAAGSILAAAATSLVPNLAALAMVQAVSRGLSHAMALLIFVFALEEAPAGSRAFVASMLALAAGLGSGLAVGSVPFADLSDSGWRLSFVAALAGLPLLVFVARRLPESLRFETARQQPRTRPPQQYRFRLAILAITSFAVLVFSAPASQLQNEFLNEQRDFSATKIAVFTLLTTWTAGPGMLIAGKLADLRGRRVIAAVGVSGGALFILWHFTQAGWPMWVLIAVGALLTSSTVPALGVYRAEMFGTMRRAESNGLLGVAGVSGSMVGLAAGGYMIETWGYGTAFSILLAGPLLVGVLVLLFYPETTRRSLEELNPEDA